MIWTPLTTIMTVLGVFGLALMVYSTTKAYRLSRKSSETSLEEKYALEKEYYLLSTVVWVVLLSRLVASGLFWVTNESLVSLIPGTMCQFGVNQNGSPYSWLDNGVKLIVIFVYGVWLSLDLINRRVKGAPLLRMLSRIFLMMTPLLFLDTVLDIAFYSVLTPAVVPCCRIIFSAASQIPCPYCFIFHDAPLFIVVVASYGLSIAMVLWSFSIRHFSKQGTDIETIGMSAIKKLMIFAMAFAIIGTLALVPAILQVMGSGGFFH